MKKHLAVLLIATALSSLVTASATTISYESSKPLKTTNWSDTLTFGKFDTSLGSLTSIQFDLSGNVKGTGRAESLDAEATSVTLSLGSLIKLMRPDGSLLVVTNPVFSRIFEFTEYDDTLDFGGSSGGSTGTVTANSADFLISSLASDFALFSAAGGGTINLGLQARGNSSATGSGNLATAFSTMAAGAAKVTYTYTQAATPLPEPESLPLVFAGLGLIGFMSKRRSRQS